MTAHRSPAPWERFRSRLEGGRELPFLLSQVPKNKACPNCLIRNHHDASRCHSCFGFFVSANERHADGRAVVRFPPKCWIVRPQTNLFEAYRSASHADPNVAEDPHTGERTVLVDP